MQSALPSVVKPPETGSSVGRRGSGIEPSTDTNESETQQQLRGLKVSGLERAIRVQG